MGAHITLGRQLDAPRRQSEPTAKVFRNMRSSLPVSILEKVLMEVLMEVLMQVLLEALGGDCNEEH